MLVLSRKEKERIVITDSTGATIWIAVEEISQFRGKPRVRLSFDGPENLVVDREEIHAAKASIVSIDLE